MGWIHEKMSDPKQVFSALYKLHKKSLMGNHHTFQIEGVSIGNIFENHKVFIQEFLTETKHGARQFFPAKKVLIQTQSKKRLIYKFHTLDIILHTMLSQILTELISPFLNPRLFSYRKGRSNWMALGEVTKYIRLHIKENKEVHQRGLFLVKRDIKSYGESIPVGENSLLWQDIDKMHVRSGKGPLDSKDLAWLKTIICPVVEGSTGLKGIPTGSPITAPLLNLYMDELDQRMETMAEGLYTRFGDDILFLSKSADQAKIAISIINEEATKRGLVYGKHKSLDIAFNGAGKSQENLPGRHLFEYLGALVNFKGTFSINTGKVLLFREELRQRVQNTVKLIRKLEISNPLEVLGKTINSMLDPHGHDSLPYCDWILTQVNNRTALHSLDHMIWQEVSMALTGQPYPYCFRILGPQKIREGLGLKSLVRSRNQKIKKYYENYRAA